LFDIFNYPYDSDPAAFDPSLAQREFDWHLDAWSHAEALGFEGVLFSEHHFTAYNMSPSPNLLVAALSQRTSRIRLGVMANITAFHNPRRLAEETAMLDYLTRGRLEVGLGRGADDHEFNKEGFPLEDTRAWFEESLGLMEQAWAEPRFTHHGRFFDYDDTALWPRPRSRPSVHIVALSPSTIQWAAAKGYKLALAFMPAPTMAQLVAGYQAAAEAAGQPTGPDRVSVLRNVFIADTDAEAREIAEPALNKVFQLFKEVAVPGDLTKMAPGYEGYSSFFAPFAKEGGVTFDELVAAGQVVVGSPETVRDQLVAQAEEICCGHVFNWFHYGALTPEQTMRSLELYAEHVIPALQQIDVLEAV
jgi:alkanesulfonate monooxygenase SsuD/methylene tetrahydromethanopterin reductase-like flavin-dependent oxidoreductase (luciferase family)